MPASDAIWLYEIQICSSVSERSLRPSIFLRLLRPSEIIWSESQPARPSIFAIAFDDMRRCLHFLRVESELSILVMSGFIIAIGQRRTSSASAATTPSTSMSLIASLHDVIA